MGLCDSPVVVTMYETVLALVGYQTSTLVDSGHCSYRRGRRVHGCAAPN